jgi:poly(3-hydroxybutyrate) depolymerase
MVRAVRVAVVVLMAGAAVAAPQAVNARRTVSPWPARSTGIGGIANYAGGEWIWQDFAYDDGGSAPQVGDGGKGNNAGDLVETRVRRAGDDLLVRVTLNSLFADEGFIRGFGWSSSNAWPVATPWPDGANVASPWEHFATVTADRVELTDGLTTTAATPVVDRANQTVEFRLPGAASGSAVQLVGGAGVRVATTGRWGSDGVLDLAFNGHAVEPFGVHSFRDTAQSAAIAAGDVSRFATTVSIADLERGRTDPPFRTPGLYDRVFRGIQELGGGYGTGCPEFKGRYQPYAFFIPPHADADTAASPKRPLALVLHSLSNVNNEFSMLHLYDQIAGERGAYAATPLARGKDCWYLNEGLVDAFDVWHDVLSNYPIDADQVTLTGYSMGGYGSYRLTEFQPDRIAAAAIFAGVPAYEIWAYPADPVPTGHPQGNTYYQLENERYIPFLIAHGTNDELVPYEGVAHQAQRFQDLGYEYRFNTYPLSEHLGSFQGMDDWAQWRDWLRGRRRETNPPEVTFSVRPDAWTDPFRTADDRQRMLGQIRDLGFDLTSAYWVHDVRVVGAGDVIGKVDLVSHGVAERVPVTSDDNSVTPGNPYLFGSPTQLGPPWGFATLGQHRTLTSSPDAPVENVLSGSLANIGSLTVDVAAAGLSLDGLGLDITVDQPVTLTLRSGSAARTVTVFPPPAPAP